MGHHGSHARPENRLNMEPKKQPTWWTLERWFDRHNHKMEFIRTVFGAMTVVLQIIIICKIFKS
jgi:hypothetical protein